VQGLTSTPKDAAIVVATIDMAHALGLKVIAEGIETVEQRDFLRDHGCDDVQGYLYAAPLQATAFLKWAKHYNALLKKG
jgi:EAL domain-containing protein (putative c-di-GMP-specific phosphodiesterase class I)